MARSEMEVACREYRATRNADERAAPCKQRQPGLNSSKQQIEIRKKRLASRLQDKRTDQQLENS